MKMMLRIQVRSVIHNYYYYTINGANLGEGCPDVTEGQLKLAAAKWILKHREGHRIPHSVMESIVVGVQSLFQLSISRMEHLVLNTMENVSADVVSSVQAIFSDGAELFKGLSTSYQQNEYIKEKFDFVVRLFGQ